MASADIASKRRAFTSVGVLGPASRADLASRSRRRRSSSGGTGSASAGRASGGGWREHLLGEHLDRRAAAERRPELEHVGEEAADRVEVGARPHRQRATLLRAHVLRRPRDHVLRRERRPLVARVVDVGQAEVDHLHRGLRRRAGEEHVVRLEIAMDDAVRVRDLERVEELREDGHHLGQRRRRVVLVQPRRQGSPFEVLHHQVKGAAIGTEVEDAHRVGVVEQRRRVRLVPEAPHVVGHRRDGRVHGLDRDRDAEPEVEPLPHLAHAALTEEALQLVLPREDLADVDLTRGDRILRLVRAQRRACIVIGLGDLGRVLGARQGGGLGSAGADEGRRHRARGRGPVAEQGLIVRDAPRIVAGAHGTARKPTASCMAKGPTPGSLHGLRWSESPP